MKVLIIGEHSYIGNSFMEFVKMATNRKDILGVCDKIINRNWEIHKIGASNEAWKQISFSGYDVILHVAGIVHKKENKHLKKLYYNINYKMVVEAAKKAKTEGVRQYVFLSTMAVYGEQVACITEETLPNPSTLYGKSKLNAEKALLKMNDASFGISILRPPLVYGVDCPGNYSKLLWLSSWMPFFPKCRNKRSMIHIDHLCMCLWLVIDRKINGVLCPRDRMPISTSDLYQEMRKARNKQTYMILIPRKILLGIGVGIPIVKKLFGDCYYHLYLEEECLNINEYQLRERSVETR